MNETIHRFIRGAGGFSRRDGLMLTLLLMLGLLLGWLDAFTLALR